MAVNRNIVVTTHDSSEIKIKLSNIFNNNLKRQTPNTTQKNNNNPD